MRLDKKYVLQRVAAYAGSLIVASSLLIYPNINSYAEIEYTQEEMKENKVYETTLNEIKEELPTFTNIDLYNELINQGIELTTTNISKLNELTITNKLNNNDFSDLKYFTNLTKLTINNNDIDCNDIKYNANLLDLNISNSNITNTSLLPNSIYNIIFNNNIIKDDIFTIPYNTKYINTTNTSFNNIYLKNPSFLSRLTIKGNTFLDISSLTECTNLEYLSLNRVPNVSNSSLLSNLNIPEIILDDYAAIWLSEETYNNININNYSLLTVIRELDNIANNIKIISDNKEDTITNITIYILNELEYDKKLNKDKLDKYNDCPIFTSFNENNAICINYASLFTALANRLDIDTYQIYSNTHTWNMIEDNNDIRFIDLTQLDTKTIVRVLENNSTLLVDLNDSSTLDILNSEEKNKLYHYTLSFEDILKDETLSQYNLLPTTSEYIEEPIGYIKNDSSIIEYNNKLYIIDNKMFRKIIIILSFILSLLPNIAKKSSKTLYYK